MYAAGAGGARVREARDPISASRRSAPRTVCVLRARAEPAVGGGGASPRGRPAAAGSGTGRGAMRPGWSMEMRIAQHVRAGEPRARAGARRRAARGPRPAPAPGRVRPLAVFQTCVVPSNLGGG